MSSGCDSGCDVVGIQFGQLLDIADDLPQLRGHHLQLLRRQPQASQQRNLFDLFAREAHEWDQSRWLAAVLRDPRTASVA